MENQRKSVAVAFIAIGIVCVMLIVFFVVKLNKNDEKEDINISIDKTVENYENAKNDIDLKGTENLIVNKDGTTINKSTKIKTAKTVAGLEISNIAVSYINRKTQINGVIKNNGVSDIDAGFVNVNILDSKDNIFKTINTYIGVVKASDSKILDIDTQSDISNMKDIEFVKK